MSAEYDYGQEQATGGHEFAEVTIPGGALQTSIGHIDNNTQQHVEHYQNAEYGNNHALESGAFCKRQLDDQGLEGPIIKRIATGDEDSVLKTGNTGYQDLCVPSAELDMVGTSAQQTLAGSSLQATVVVDCPQDKVGKLIGRGGSTIREIQSKSSTKIQVDYEVAGEIKPVSIIGLPRNIDHARVLIKEALEVENNFGVNISKTIECPQDVVGRIIGKGGDVIRNLQQASGAQIVVEQNFPDGVPRKLHINGHGDAVQRASSMLTEIMGGAPVSTQSIIQKYGIGITRVVDCPKAMIGKVIGKGGEVIKNLQKSFGVTLQIDQSSDPCHVTITGAAMAVESAMRAVHERIQPMDQMHFQGQGHGYESSFPATPMGMHQYGIDPYGAYGAMPAAPSFGYYTAPQYGQDFAPVQTIMPSYPSYPSFGSADPYASSYSGSYRYGSEAVSGPATGVWQEQKDNEGRIYYYNSQTGVSQWEKPQ